MCAEFETNWESRPVQSRLVQALSYLQSPGPFFSGCPGRKPPSQEHKVEPEAEAAGEDRRQNIIVDVENATGVSIPSEDPTVEPASVTIDDDRMVFDFRGACPELANRSINTHISAFKTCLATNMILYVWPDLPVNQAIFSPIEMPTNRNSLVDPSNDSPNAMSLLPLFRAMLYLFIQLLSYL